ncbi:hypothetical protein SteCoe_14726 [Stentor coeruleus]|uniref:Uncharacterized protein n=1 Tax=Stentor coeruleus TaxID=5963 RepID=A0A1R2C5G2_9CILI|nr:hypothetical protein SteCoe_14726 [Stentor coeruleus]
MAIVEDSARNTFLQEIERNSDIGSDIRREIEYRYSCSIVNKNYRFPRSNESTSPVIKLKKNPSKHSLDKSKEKIRMMSSVYLHKQTPTTKLPVLKSSILKPLGNTLKKLIKPKAEKSASSNVSIFNTSIIAIPKNVLFKSKTCIKANRLRKFDELIK